MTRATAIQLVLGELDKAEEKFPTFPTDPIHAAGVVGEESGELQQAALQWTYETGDRTHCIKEAIQTAAMALRFIIAAQDMGPRPSYQVPTDDER